MAKIKMSKKATSIDMTAMCDVAFLLLTFFILTATAKQPEALKVETPNSTRETKLPENDLAMITVGSGKVFFSVKGKEIRKKALKYMGQKYGIAFTPKEYEEFGLIENFGVPMNDLRRILSLNNTERNKEGSQAGIPKDSLDNQLKDWIYFSRIATSEEHQGQKMAVAIKGDAKQEYPDIRKIMDILQEQDINSFNLVTGLRGRNF
jgi:biopolymer transport protein ExbD